MLTELKTVTEPATEMTTATVKSFLRVDFSDDDTLIELLIKQAREKCEAYCNRAFITQTLEAYYDMVQYKINLPRAPIQSVTSVTLKYLGTSTALTANQDYYVMGNKDKWLEISATGYALPVGFSPDDDLGMYYLDVVYVAGYGTAYTSVPAGIQIAIMKMVQSYYDNREQVALGTIVAELPNDVKSLLNPYRVIPI